MRKWVSNSKQALSTIEEDFAETANSYPVEEYKSVKALGLKWHPSKDIFQFSVTLDSINKMKCFVRDIKVIRAEAYSAPIWLAEVGWDDPLPESNKLSVCKI